jgi:hypothetical protein
MAKAILSVLGAAALGAGAMYFYDPKLGAKRRAEAGEAALKAKKKLARAADATSKSVRFKTSSLIENSRRVLGRSAASSAALWSPRTRAAVAAAGLLLAALAGVRPQS